jgi:CheY-like chemotaxis protein
MIAISTFPQNICLMLPVKPMVLIAEDDVNDAVLLQRTLKKLGLITQVHIVRDGAEAIEYLEGHSKYTDRSIYPFPTIIITDLKMPRLDGFDVLQWLHERPECSIIPTIVWSSSAQQSDVTKAYKLGANCYLQKPADLNVWEQKIALAFNFWEACEKPFLTAAKCSPAMSA